MKQMNLLSSKRLAILACCLSLVACSGNEEMIALQNYVSSAVNRAPTPIEPLPQFVAYEAFTYSAASLRSPFDLPVDLSVLLNNQRNNQVMPDENRTPELLESFQLGALLMVGTLTREGQTWALVRDETGNVTRVTRGNYMGRNHGRIINITSAQIELVEIVPTGSGSWIERPQTVQLGQP
jgi:type IV pilus assembly protein PilP